MRRQLPVRVRIAYGAALMRLRVLHQHRMELAQDAGSDSANQRLAAVTRPPVV
jgi:hypothetical protein